LIPERRTARRIGEIRHSTGRNDGRTSLFIADATTTLFERYVKSSIRRITQQERSIRYRFPLYLNSGSAGRRGSRLPPRLLHFRAPFAPVVPRNRRCVQVPLLRRCAGRAPGKEAVPRRRTEILSPPVRRERAPSGSPVRVPPLLLHWRMVRSRTAASRLPGTGSRGIRVGGELTTTRPVFRDPAPETVPRRGGREQTTRFPEKSQPSIFAEPSSPPDPGSLPRKTQP